MLGKNPPNHILIDTTRRPSSSARQFVDSPTSYCAVSFRQRRERYQRPDAPGLGYGQREVDVFMLEDLYDSRVPGGAVGFLAGIVALSKMYVADIFHSLSWSLLFINDAFQNSYGHFLD